MIDDEEIVHNTLTPYFHDLGHSVNNASNGTAALKMIEENDYDLVFIDILMPGMDGLSLLQKIGELRPELSSVIITGHGNMDMVIQALRLGAVDFLTKPIKLLEIDAVIEKSKRVRFLKLGNRHLTETIAAIQTTEDSRIRNRSLVCESQAMREVQKQIHLAADAKGGSVLITGETGTGKEVVAREIHFIGHKGDSPFIAVGCPAIPDTLIESELFGHVKGSYTGATFDRAGYFEMADGGTLFLDEIADLSQSAQAKLLRVLETRKLRRVGGPEEISVNISIIAATNVPLEELVEKKSFRSDLFYRLNFFTIKLLPLRERRVDIIPLARYFLSNFILGRGLKIEGFSKEANDLLINYDYPGNVRELRNIVERAAIITREGIIQQRHLNIRKSNHKTIQGVDQPKNDEDRIRILEALNKAKWNRAKAAKALGISYAAMRHKIQKYGIK